MLPLEGLTSSLNRLVDDNSVDSDFELPSTTSDSSNATDTSDTIYDIFEYIFENIDGLYRLGNLIDRPRLANRYLSSTQPIADLGYQYEHQHVIEKIDLWQREQEMSFLEEQDEELPARAGNPQEEETATPEIIANRQSARGTEDQPQSFLSCRIAIANMKRRKQLMYWDIHPYQIDADIPKKIDEVTSAIDALAFSTVARSQIIFDPQKLGRNETAPTMYTASLPENDASIRVPDLPELDNASDSFECPYCHMTLPVEQMKVRSNWK